MKVLEMGNRLMNEKSEFYTLKGYRLQQSNSITEAMEDYLEMIFRISGGKEKIRIKDLSDRLNVKPSSASKMVRRLSELKLVIFEKYGMIMLTESGYNLGKFFLWRHNVLVSFFKWLNGNQYCLGQVEKIEHFIDLNTLSNMEKFLNFK